MCYSKWRCLSVIFDTIKIDKFNINIYLIYKSINFTIKYEFWKVTQNSCNLIEYFIKI